MATMYDKDIKDSHITIKLQALSLFFNIRLSYLDWYQPDEKCGLAETSENDNPPPCSK